MPVASGCGEHGVSSVGKASALCLALHVPSGSVQYHYHWCYFRPHGKHWGATVSEALSQREVNLSLQGGRHLLEAQHTCKVGGGGCPGWREAQTLVSSTSVLSLSVGREAIEGQPFPFDQAHPRSWSQSDGLPLASRGAGRCHLRPAETQRRGLHGQQDDTAAVSRLATAPAPVVGPGDFNSAAQAGARWWRQGEGVPVGGRAWATGENRMAGEPERQCDPCTLRGGQRPGHSSRPQGDVGTPSGPRGATKEL